jgi:hypothetical protein
VRSPSVGWPWSIAASHHGTVTTWSSALVGFATLLRQETPPRAEVHDPPELTSVA